MRETDHMDTHVLDDAYTILVETDENSAYNDQREWVVTYTSKRWWLLKNDTPVAFLKTLFDHRESTREGGLPFGLCDIEVRPEHRGNGHTRRIVAAVEAVEGHTMYTTGGFTPLGAQALSWVPVYPWDTPGVAYADMTFVHDWDTLTAEHSF